MTNDNEHATDSSQETAQLKQRILELEELSAAQASEVMKLRERESKLAIVTSQLGGWYWECDLTGLIVFSGKGIQHLLGFLPEEVVLHPYSDLFSPEVKVELSQGFETVIGMQQPVTNFINKKLRKDYGVVWISSSIAPFYDQRGVCSGFCGMDIDISEQIACEKRNRELIEREHRFIEVSGEGIVIHDDGVIIETNQPFADMLGYQLNELMGQSIRKLIHDDSFTALANLFPHNLGETYDVVLVKRDGGTIFAEVKETTILIKDRLLRVATIRNITDRKIAEKALRDSEESYRFLFNNAPLGISLLSPDGKYLRCNDRFLKMLGYSEKELKNPHPSIIKHPALIDEIIATVKTQRMVQGYEVELVRKDGEPLWVRLTVAALSKDGEDIIMAMVEDITSAQSAKQALAASNQGYRDLLDSSLVGIVVSDRNGAVTGANQSAADLLGYGDPDFLTGIDVETVYVNRDLYRRILNRLQNHAQVRPGEIQVYRKDGSVMNILGSSVARFDEDGRLTSVEGFFTDISELKIVEQKLMEHNTLLETMREIDLAILTAQSATALINLTGKYLRRLIKRLGYAISIITLETGEKKIFAFDIGSGPVFPDEIGCSCKDDLHCYDYLLAETYIWKSDLWESNCDSLERQLIELGVRGYLEIPLVAYNELIGSLLLLENSLEPFSQHEIDIAQDLARSLAIAIQQTRLLERNRAYNQDLEYTVDERTKELSTRIHEVEALNANLKQITEDLRAANSELVTISLALSHDLKQPLRTIHGYASTLLYDYASELAPTGREYAQKIKTSIEKMDTLIEELFIYHNLSTNKPALFTVTLEPILDNALVFLRASTAESRAVIDIEKPLHSVIGSKKLLIQVFIHLLSNAVKFVNPGVIPKIRIRSESRGEMVRVWIEDNGIGIDQCYKTKIYKLFERLVSAEAYPGNGVGLALAYKMIHLMNGEIDFESEPGNGCHFYFELPAG